MEKSDRELAIEIIIKVEQALRESNLEPIRQMLAEHSSQYKSIHENIALIRSTSRAKHFLAPEWFKLRDILTDVYKPSLLIGLYNDNDDSLPRP